MNDRRANAFLLSAMAAPLVQAAGGENWVSVLLLCGAGTALSLGCSLLPFSVPPKWLAVLQWGYFAVTAAYLAQWTVWCWPEQQSYPMIPLVMLALAAFVGTGADRAGKACAVLLWFLAGLFALVAVAGSADVKWRWLTPTVPRWDPTLVLVAILPLFGYPYREKKGRRWLLLLIPIFACGASVLCSGVLSGAVAQEESFAFYEASRSLSLFGVMERFESVVAAAMTLGYFCTLSYLMSFAAEAAEILYPGFRKWGGRACALAAGALVLLPVRFLPAGLVLGGVLLFGPIPAAMILAGKKKGKKEEKSS